ncbi:MAG TPA: hypothetical protein VIY09_05690 [Rhizomicrobium sp.]
MKQRDNLLRLKRFRIDALKRQMATLSAMSADVDRKLLDLEDGIARERQRANDSDLGRLAFPSFLRAMDCRRENLRATLKEIGREREQAQLELARVGEEVQALEVTAEQEIRRAAESQLHKSRMRLQDLALSRHLRRQTLRQM